MKHIQESIIGRKGYTPNGFTIIINQLRKKMSVPDYNNVFAVWPTDATGVEIMDEAISKIQSDIERVTLKKLGESVGFLGTGWDFQNIRTDEKSEYVIFTFVKPMSVKKAMDWLETHASPGISIADEYPNIIQKIYWDEIKF